MMKFEDGFKYDKQKYEIIIFFFDNMIRHNFMKIINNMGKDINYSDEVAGYTFANSREDDDRIFFVNGVCFHYFDDYVVVNYKMFVECIELAARVFAEDGISEEDQAIVNENINQIKKRYHIGVVSNVRKFTVTSDNILSSII